MKEHSMRMTPRLQFSGKEDGGSRNEVTLAHVALNPSVHLGPATWFNSLLEHGLVFISTVLLLLGR